MTAQMTLNAIALLFTASFVVCFFVDLFTTVRRAWKDTSPKIKNSSDVKQQSHKIINPNQIQPALKPASLDWINPQELQEETEVVNIIEIAKKRSFKKPQIETLPQTEEAKQLQKRLVPSNNLPDYSTPRLSAEQLKFMNVKKLRQEARVRNIKNTGSMVKQQLIEAILAA